MTTNGHEAYGHVLAQAQTSIHVSSGQPRPQIAGADEQDENADYPADHRLGKPWLQLGADIGTRKAASSEGDPRGPVRRYRAVLVDRQDSERDDAGH